MTHTQISLGEGDAAKTFAADNQLVLTVDGKATPRLTSWADPLLRPERPLAAKDQPGSLTVSVDGGPEFDWAAGRWASPDTEMFLVNDSDRFWNENAPAFTLAPGPHTLRVKGLSPFAPLAGDGRAHRAGPGVSGPAPPRAAKPARPGAAALLPGPLLRSGSPAIQPAR